MKYVVLTGMSGSGKSTALNFFEDIGYFCVDNLPPSLIFKFVELFSKSNMETDKVAIGVDIRGGKLFDYFFNYLDELKRNINNFEVLFLDCSDTVLLKRYKETRRIHPLAREERIINGIFKERELLKEIRKKSNYIIDTSNILTRQLREKIHEIFIEDKEFKSLIITVISFGFKYGVPLDADLIFDVRFLPNPFYIEELKFLTGNDKPIFDYVMNFDESRIFLSKLKDMLNFLIPNYIKEGKSRLVIGIGCTGGKHRSVTLANKLVSDLDNICNSSVIFHRDIDKNNNK